MGWLSLLLGTTLLLGVAYAGMMEAEQLLNSGIDLAQAGKMKEAAPLFVKAATEAPENPDINFNCGFFFMQMHDLNRALSYFERTISLQPQFREAHIKAAMINRDLNRPMEVIKYLKSAIALDPSKPDLYLYLGDTLNNMKQWQEAVKVYGQALQVLDPTYQASSPTNIHISSDESSSDELSKDVSSSDDLDKPVNPFKSKPDTAKKRTAQKPTNQRILDPKTRSMASSAHLRLGDSLGNLKRSVESKSHYLRGVELEPDNGELLSSLWFSLLELSDWSQVSLPQQEQSVKKRTSSQTTATQKSMTDFEELGVLSYKSAINVIKQSRGSQPSPLSPYRALFLDMPPSKTVHLATSWSKGLIKPVVQAALVDTQQKEVIASGGGGGKGGGREKKDIDRLRVGFISRRFERYPGTQLMLGLFSHFNTAVNQQHRQLERHQQETVTDFSDQAGTVSTSSPTPRFSVFAYAHGRDDGSSEREVIKLCADRFRDISDMSVDPKDHLNQVLDDKIDIFVDYDGLHDFNNIEFLTKLATQSSQVFVTWLGFGGPTGLGKRQLLRAKETKSGVVPNNSQKNVIPPNQALFGGGLMDYVICDSVVIEPFESMRSYTESLLILPHSYQPQDELQNDIADELGLFVQIGREEHRYNTRLGLARKNRLKTPFSSSSSSSVGDQPSISLKEDDEPISFDHIRKDRHERYGFPPNAIVLACLNRNNKITPTAFDDWMNIMQRTHNTVLWLQTKSKESKTVSATDLFTRERVLEEAAARGVHSSRIYFAEKANRTEYFRRLACVDLFLDSRPYGSHTVAADALFTQTPVLTLPGSSFASRVPHSLYKAATKTATKTVKVKMEDKQDDPLVEEIKHGSYTVSTTIAKKLESLLVVYDRLSYVNTAVALCNGVIGGNIYDELIVHESPSSFSSPHSVSLLSLLRLMIRVAMSPSKSPAELRFIKQDDKPHSLKGNESKTLFNSALFASKMEQAFQAMKEVKHVYEQNSLLIDDESSKSTNQKSSFTLGNPGSMAGLVLPHIFFDRTR